jgi:hypothetical protein
MMVEVSVKKSIRPSILRVAGRPVCPSSETCKNSSTVAFGQMLLVYADLWELNRWVVKQLTNEQRLLTGFSRESLCSYRDTTVPFSIAASCFVCANDRSFTKTKRYVWFRCCLSLALRCARCFQVPAAMEVESFLECFRRALVEFPHAFSLLSHHS